MKTQKKAQRKVLWSIITLALAVLTVFLVFKSSGMTLAQLGEVLKSADKKWLLPAALVSLGMVFFEGQAVLVILRRAGYRQRQHRGFIYAAADCYFSAITPSATGGQPASAFFMVMDGVPPAVTTACLLANLVMYNAAILTIGILCILFRSDLFFHFQPGCQLLIVLGIVVLAVMGLIFFGLLWRQQILSKILTALIRFLARIKLMRHPERWEERLRLAMIEYKACVDLLSGSKSVWILAFLFNLLQRFCQFMVTVLVGLAIGVGNSLSDLIDLWATQCFVSLGANCVPIPGSMGVTDYLMLDGYLNLMDKQSAYELQILTRGLSFYFTVLFSGAVVLVAYLLLRKKKPREMPKERDDHGSNSDKQAD